MNPMLLSRLFAAQQEPQWGPSPYAQQNYGVPQGQPPRHAPQPPSNGPAVDNVYPAMGAEGEDAGAFGEPDVMPSFESMFGDSHGVEMMEPTPITGPGPQITEVPQEEPPLTLEQLPADLWGQQQGAGGGPPGGPLGSMYAPPIRGGRMSSR